MKHLKKFNEAEYYHGFTDDNDEKYSDFLPKPGDFTTKPGFAEKRAQQQKHYESKYMISIPVPVSAYELLKKKGVPDENITLAYRDYLSYKLGTSIGTDLEEFQIWCEVDDNLVDFLDN